MGIRRSTQGRRFGAALFILTNTREGEKTMPTNLDPVCGAQVEEEIAIAESEYLGAR